MPKVTIQDVAREAGVALGTVSNVLNHPDRVRPSTLDRVRAAMDALGYAPNQSARLLAGGGSMTFGLLLPNLSSGFALQVANGAQSEARRAGYDVVIASAAGDAELERRHLRYLVGTQVAGVLIQPVELGYCNVRVEDGSGAGAVAGAGAGLASASAISAPDAAGTAESDALAGGADAAGGSGAAGATAPDTAPDPCAFDPRPTDALMGSIPHVYLGLSSDEPGYFVSGGADGQGALVAEYALRSGAAHVLVAGAQRSRACRDRAAGIERVARDAAGVRFEFLEEGPLARDGMDLARSIARRPEADRPDFIIALSDALAVGIIAGLEAAGVSVPGSIAVAGCEGNPLAWTGRLALTTVVPSGYEVGRRGVQMLLEQIELAKLAELTGEMDPGADPALNHQATVRPFLLQRASTGADGGAAAPDLDVGPLLS
ncbi:MAG: LacI family DNA-binding transcriptional regulator [Collinsella sp.]|nr:LacI family DNA-binding transcriptional regulator [Collinsella sp.]